MAKDTEKTAEQIAVEKLNKQLEDLQGDLSRVIAENGKLLTTLGEKDQQISALKLQIEGQPRAVVKGFVLEYGDPFAEGVMRQYLAESKDTRQPPHLPFVIPFDGKEPAAAAAVGYLQRAVGAGDTVRAGKLKDVFAEFKKSLTQPVVKKLAGSLLAQV